MVEGRAVGNLEPPRREDRARAVPRAERRGARRSRCRRCRRDPLLLVTPIVDPEMRAYYDRRAAEYDDWWLGTGLFASRDRPGWDEEVAALVGVIAALRTWPRARCRLRDRLPDPPSPRRRRCARPEREHGCDRRRRACRMPRSSPRMPCRSRFPTASSTASSRATSTVTFCRRSVRRSSPRPAAPPASWSSSTRRSARTSRRRSGRSASSRTARATASTSGTSARRGSRPRSEPRERSSTAPGSWR